MAQFHKSDCICVRCEGVRSREADAARYRWLRAQCEDENSAWCVYRLGNELPARLDDAIDAAMNAETVSRE